MAQLVETKLVDDIDGSEGSETVGFSLDGRTMEIDLSAANAARLRETLAPFIAAARRAGGSSVSVRQSSRRSGRSREESAQIRSWLSEHGYEVSERGRMPNELLQAYEAGRAAPKPAQTDAQATGGALAVEAVPENAAKSRRRRTKKAAELGDGRCRRLRVVRLDAACWSPISRRATQAA